jgi:hypothetical protein
MRRLWLAGVMVAVAAVSHQQETFDTLARAALPRIAGETVAPGLREPVEVVRDAAGVPHIYARRTWTTSSLPRASCTRRIVSGRWTCTGARSRVDMAEVMGPTNTWSMTA